MTRISILATCLLLTLASCSDDEGEVGAQCGGLAGIPCSGSLSCCIAEPIVDGFGECVAADSLAGEGEPCGVTSGSCCAGGLVCEFADGESDGVCRGQ